MGNEASKAGSRKGKNDGSSPTHAGEAGEPESVDVPVTCEDGEDASLAIKSKLGLSKTIEHTYVPVTVSRITFLRYSCKSGMILMSLLLSRSRILILLRFLVRVALARFSSCANGLERMREQSMR